MPDIFKLGLYKPKPKVAVMKPPKIKTETPAAPSADHQLLVQPINKMLVGYGYLNAEYKRKGVVVFANGQHGDHYGTDLWNATADKTLYSPGAGEVVAAGLDSTFGNIVVLRLPKCLNHRTGEIVNTVWRFAHLDRIFVKAGQKVTKDTRLGIIGKTGKYCNGVHTHAEVDRNYDDPLAVPSIVRTNMLHPARSHTHDDPAAYLHTKASRPDNQTVRSANNSRYDYQAGGKPSDWIFPIIK